MNVKLLDNKAVCRNHGPKINVGCSNLCLYPGIYTEDYTDFVFPFIHSFVPSWFRPVRGITLKF